MNGRIASLLVFLLLTGCPTHKTPSAPPPSTTSTSLDTPRAILEADANLPGVQLALADIALASTRTSTLRYLALRKLEEVHAPSIVSVAKSLALESGTGTEAKFLQNNAVGVLVRAKKTPEGGQALEAVKHSSAAAAATAGQLERSGS